MKIRSFVLEEHRRETPRRNGKCAGYCGNGSSHRACPAAHGGADKKKRELRDYLIGRIEAEIPYCRLNGDRTDRLPNNVNFSFRFMEGESLLIMLDMKGICASSGSASASGSIRIGLAVLLAIGLPHRSHTARCISFWRRYNKKRVFLDVIQWRHYEKIVANSGASL